jgi:uncharacterized Tic20 family protein
MTEPPRPPGGGNPDELPPDPTAAPPYPPGTANGSPPPGPPGYPPPASAPPGSDAGGYPPPPGYPPPGAAPGGDPPPGGTYQSGTYGAQPTGYPTADDKTWALIAHFGGILVGFIAPLVTLLTKGKESATVRAHSMEALNFQITWGIAMVVATILAVCSLGILSFLPLIVWIVVVVFAVIAGVRANDGHLYRYPMSYRFLK